MPSARSCASRAAEAARTSSARRRAISSTCSVFSFSSSCSTSLIVGSYTDACGFLPEAARGCPTSHDPEGQRGRADRSTAVALVVQGELHADAARAVGASSRVAVDSERTDLAAREEHEVVGLGLQLVGAGELGREVDGGGLVDHELRADVQRGVGGRELGLQLPETPVAVGALAPPEDLPDRREIGRVLDVLDRVVLEHLVALDVGRHLADRRPLALDEREHAVVVVGVDDRRPPEVHAGADLERARVDHLDALHVVAVVEDLQRVDHRVGYDLEVGRTTTAGRADRQDLRQDSARRVAHVVAERDRVVVDLVHRGELTADVAIAHQRTPPLAERLPVLVLVGVADVFERHWCVLLRPTTYASASSFSRLPPMTALRVSSERLSIASENASGSRMPSGCGKSEPHIVLSTPSSSISPMGSGSENAWMNTLRRSATIGSSSKSCGVRS